MDPIKRASNLILSNAQVPVRKVGLITCNLIVEVRRYEPVVCPRSQVAADDAVFGDRRLAVGRDGQRGGQEGRAEDLGHGFFYLSVCLSASGGLLKKDPASPQGFISEIAISIGDLFCLS